jgi:hypothetical protein
MVEGRKGVHSNSLCSSFEVRGLRGDHSVVWVARSSVAFCLWCLSLQVGINDTVTLTVSLSRSYGTIVLVSAICDCVVFLYLRPMAVLVEGRKECLGVGIAMAWSELWDDVVMACFAVRFKKCFHTAWMAIAVGVGAGHPADTQLVSDCFAGRLCFSSVLRSHSDKQESKDNNDKSVSPNLTVRYPISKSQDRCMARTYSRSVQSNSRGAVLHRSLPICVRFLSIRAGHIGMEQLTTKRINLFYSPMIECHT